MFRLCLLVFAVICSADLYAQQATPSPAVRRILDKTVADVRKNRQEFDKANQKPLGDARVELQDLSTKLIKDGKTVDATAVLKQIETLDVDVMKMANAPAPVAGGGGAVQQKPLLESLAGKWTHPNSKVVHDFDKNGKATASFRGGDTINGSVNLLSENEVEVRWSSQYVSRFLLLDEDTIIERAFKPDGREQGEGYLKMRVR